MRKILSASVALAAVISASCALYQGTSYEYPYQQLGDPDMGGFLRRDGSVTVELEMRAMSREIEISAVNWNAPGTATTDSRTESLSFVPTALAKRIPDLVFVAGVADNGVTILESWQITTAISVSGQISIRLSKTMLAESAELTHLRALAASPNGDFLIAQHHETSEVYRIDLPSLKRTTILTRQDDPPSNLSEFDWVMWKRHVTQGDAFLLFKGARSPHAWSGTKTWLILWDGDLDGTPNLIEEISIAEVMARGYDESAIWIPDRDNY